MLFCLPPEQAHYFTLTVLKYLVRFRLLPRINCHTQSCEVMGLRFPNPIGLAAGFDKNGDYIDCLGHLGFGFLELGTVTPKPQPGNPKPRLFRLKCYHGIINRMGFNNKGVDHLVKQVKKSHYCGVIGINIGKNATTPLEKAVDDYLICLEKVYSVADYIVINISSPNTKDLRQLQKGKHFSHLLQQLKYKQKQLYNNSKQYVPLVIKVAPDQSLVDIEHMVAVMCEYRIDGLIVANTSANREGVIDHCYAREPGGLSGKPITQKSNDILKIFAEKLQGRVPLIGVGGIEDIIVAEEKYRLGASLLQVYTGLIYQGPGLIKALISLKRPA